MDKLMIIKEMADIVYVLAQSFSLVLTSMATYNYVAKKCSKKPPKSANLSGSSRKK